MLLKSICLFLFSLLVMLASNYLEGGMFSSLLMFTSLLFVASGIIVPIFIAFSWQEILKILTISYSSDSVASSSEYKKALTFFKLLGDSAVLSGIVGFVFGLISTMDRFKNVELLTSSLSVAIVPVLYGLVVKLLVSYPLTASVQSKIIPKDL